MEKEEIRDELLSLMKLYFDKKYDLEKIDNLQSGNKGIEVTYKGNKYIIEIW